MMNFENILVSNPGRIAVDELDDIRTAIDLVITSGQFIGGKFVKNFEDEFSEYLGAHQNVISTACGQDALQLALTSLEIESNSLVVVPPNDGGFSAVATRASGLRPMVIDVNEQGLITLDEILAIPDNVRKEIKAIVVTHLHGQVIDLREIVKWTSENNVWLVEDCSQAAGAESFGKKVGTFGDVASYSFYPTKNLGALGDGGAVVTKHHHLKIKIERLKNYGWTPKYYVLEDSGMNSRLDAIQAAILSARLKHLDGNNQIRIDIFKTYCENLQKTNFLSRNQKDFIAHHVVLMSPFRERLQELLNSHGVDSDIHYPFLNSQMPSFNKLAFIEIVQAKRLSEQVLTIPCYPTMNVDEINKVINALKTAEYSNVT
ncbi:MAG: hypothetical protein RL741_462 [Actinomycetota bacterium]|jgi:dTDP-4-amino-4,6-dideoxygalactose transaminase